jgi:protoporphyrinogen oxidase
MYLRGRWVHFPLKPLDLAVSVPPAFLAGALRDAVIKPPRRQPETFASVLERGLGPTICRDFYFPFALKIWGVPADALDAEQARRRVAAGSVGRLARKVLGAVPGFKPAGAGRFFYPRHGFGQISEAYEVAARQAGAAVLLGSSAQRLRCDAMRVRSVTVATGNGDRELDADLVLSTIPLPAVARIAEPPVSQSVLDAAGSLRYRAMLLVYLVLGTERFTEFDAHYFPSPDIPMTRVSEPKNYSLEGPAGQTVLCAEMPCATTDEVWSASDDALRVRVLDGLARAGLSVRAPVRHVAVRRLTHAYPIYLRGYRIAFERLDRWAGDMDGFVSLGRQGLFAHDNTHHTLAMAYAAAACVRDDGRFDGETWGTHRHAFESHVVED